MVMRVPSPGSRPPGSGDVGSARHPVDVLRIYDSIRTAHLERFRTMTPAVVLYRHERYDFDRSVAPAGIVLSKRGRVGTLAELLRSEYRAVEINEPLMTGRWADVLCQIAAIRLRDRLHRRRTRISAYCLGLTDPAEKLYLRRRLPTRVGRPWSKFVIRLAVRSIDRLAFGTEASMRLLAGYAGERLVASRGRHFPALPSPCGCPAEPASDSRAVLFLGAFNERKGIRLLMRAWDVLSTESGLRLTVVGTGALADEVAAWASGRPLVRVIVDPPRSEIHRCLRRAGVLVLPSQRVGAWREQVGLPILEALAHGCEVVTTDETGLAAWLSAQGHRVLPSACGAAELAGAVASAASTARPAAEIMAALPDEDSRVAADAWMLGPDPALAETATARRPRPTGRAQLSHYYVSVRRSVARYGVHPARLLASVDPCPVFIVGSPRSGTTFTAVTTGRVRGFADLGELRPLKAVIGELWALPREEAAARIRRTLIFAQRLGFTAGLRAIEQTPESTFLIPAIVSAFPNARFVHLVRDGRDVAASLIRLGWLRDDRGGRVDEVGAAFGGHPRFWVETGRAGEFAAASEATRAAWVWRRYESTARRELAETRAHSLEIRYESLVRAPAAVARDLARFLDADDRTDDFVAAFGSTNASAIGRWRHDLDEAQLADVTRECSALLAELGYRG